MSSAPQSMGGPEARKARGAFFTPAPVAEFITDWAVRSGSDLVLDPSCGDAAFLTPAARRIRELNSRGGAGASRAGYPDISVGSTTATGSHTAAASEDGAGSGEVYGVEIHAETATQAQEIVEDAGGRARLWVQDFFTFTSDMRFDAVIGNPPYVRYQGFSGQARANAMEAALQAGVTISALASSWAPFVLQASRFLRPGGRLGFVLPAELLSVNYAGPVRRFLLANFGAVQLVLFEHQVFSDAQADVVLLLADRYGESTTLATVRQARDEHHLEEAGALPAWSPENPAGKWTDLFVPSAASDSIARLQAEASFAPLEVWGATHLGAVTGGNKYFALSPQQVRELGLPRRDLVRISPPGSKHLRGLELTTAMLNRLGKSDKATWLFAPSANPSPAAQAYIDAGHAAGIDAAYKCRVRSPWWQVPLLEPPDLFLTCMNADTPRLTTNSARVRHLNSVHGVYLNEETQDIGRELLPLASLNSVTLLNAETTGRTYGGGILKLEPREANTWAMPSPDVVAQHAPELRKIRRSVLARLRKGKLLDAVHLVDSVLLEDLLTTDEISAIRSARQRISHRRITRGRGHGHTESIHKDNGLETL